MRYILLLHALVLSACAAKQAGVTPVNYATSGYGGSPFAPRYIPPADPSASYVNYPKPSEEEVIQSVRSHDPKVGDTLSSRMQSNSQTQTQEDDGSNALILLGIAAMAAGGGNQDDCDCDY